MPAVHDPVIEPSASEQLLGHEETVLDFKGEASSGIARIQADMSRYQRPYSVLRAAS